jgi:hypothetical protein
MKILLIVLAILFASVILRKLVFPLIGTLLKTALAVIIPLILVAIVAITIFVGAAGFSGLTQSVDEDGGAPIADEYEVVQEINSKIDEKIDSMEGGKLDLWIKKKQKQYNEKHP